MTKKNDLAAAFHNITSVKPSEPEPAETKEPTKAERLEEAVPSYSETSIAAIPPSQSAIPLKKKEKEELRNVRKQFAITESLSNKLKEKSKELGISENEIIIQLLTYM